MRQVLSWRFVAALVGVLALALGAFVIRSRQTTFTPVAAAPGELARRIDFVSLVSSFETSGFEITPFGTTSGSLTLVLPDDRRVSVFPGTPGEVQCQNLTDPFQCAVLAEVLGDTIIWFALVPMAQSLRFELPAITELQDGYAVLTNNWEVPYARVIDRAPCDPDVASFREFIEDHGVNFRSIYDLSADAIVAVICDRTAAPPSSAPATTVN
ncbi:hypothetical protein BH24ACT5_BH24ACT5_06920 [soil metagenome]